MVEMSDFRLEVLKLLMSPLQRTSSSSSETNDRNDEVIPVSP